MRPYDSAENVMIAVPSSRAVGKSSVSMPGCAALCRIITQSHGAFVIAVRASSR